MTTCVSTCLVQCYGRESRSNALSHFPIMAHCAFIRRFVSIWRQSLPLQMPDIPQRKHQNPPKGVDDAIDREFNDLFDQWRKLTSETLSELFERSEIDESALLGKAIPHPAQVNSVK